MFDGNYFGHNEKRIKGIVDYYGYKFFYMKKLLDLGCGYADMSGVLYRLGSDVTAVDARQDHLKIVSKKFTGIKVTQADLDGQWPFSGQKYDMILDLGLLCHLASYEKHLKAVCASTANLVLETAVCDSTDPKKCIQIEESKAIYDLSYGGMGCRPSPAAIERVLTECGMTFKRVINSKFNSGDYKYDWAPQGDNSVSINKRAIWFASRNNASNNQLPEQAPITLSVSAPHNAQSIKNGIPVKTTVSPRIPISARANPAVRGAPFIPPKEINNAPISLDRKPLELNSQIRKTSKDFSVIHSEKHTSTNSLAISGVIFPTTHSSKMWCKKIASLLPNIKLFDKTLGLIGLEKTNQSPDIVMCSVDNIQSNKRVWIDEWVGPAITSQHIDILKHCETIVVPSLINAQEIWKAWPQAKIIRCARPWPLLQETANETGHYLYFEKSEYMTKLLLSAWENNFGKLVIVGASTKVSSDITFVSDAMPYSNISKLVIGAKSVIDLTDNNYYQSGIISLALGVGIPVITNNHAHWSDNVTPIQQDKVISPFPTSSNIKESISKFATNYGGRGAMKDDYNALIEQDIRKILGA